jgi:hypothetical protein
MFEFLSLAAVLLLQGCNRAYDYLRGCFTRLGVPDPATDLKVPKEEFDAALTATQDPNHTPADTREKNRAQKAVIKAYRKYANENLVHNPRLTDMDILELQLHERKPSAPIIPPNLIPIVVVVLSLLRQVTFKYYAQPGPKQRMGKPKGVAKFVAYYLISDTPPKDVSELVNRAEVSDGPLVLNFREADRGKRLYYVVCWAIAHNGLEGPKSQIEFVIIP